MANKLKELKESLRGTYAEGDIHFDNPKRVLRVTGWFTAWSLSSIFLLVPTLLMLLVSGGVFLAGMYTAGQISLGVALGCGLVFGVSFARPGLVFDLPRGEIVYRGRRIPFGQVGGEHFRWHEGASYIGLDFVTPDFTKRIATFEKRHRDRAERFFVLLRQLLQAPVGGSLTPAQRWIVGCFATIAGTTGVERGEMVRFNGSEQAGWLSKMKRDWDVYVPQDVDKTIEWLVQDGHREQLSSDNPAQLLAWDYCRALWLYQIGCGLGWYDADHCWDRMLPLARDVQRHYSSWEEMNDAYVEGRRRWAEVTGASHQDYVRRVSRRLVSDPSCPWNQVGWDLPLHRDW